MTALVTNMVTNWSSILVETDGILVRKLWKMFG